jgi:ABC-2 type transport system permease protein
MRHRQVAALARRSIIGTVRQPALIFPSLFFPLLFAALNSAAFERTTRLPGFPKVDSFLDFVLATTVVQGVLFGAIGGGADMATDIEDGFFDRLAASPVPRSFILVGRLAGTAVLGAFQAVVFMAILMSFGATVKGGVPAMVAIVLVASVLALGVGGFAVTLALRTGSAEAVQGSFPLFFISVFISSAFFPRQLMHGWFRAVATVNPISWMVESLRHLVIVGFDAGSVCRAALIVGVLAVGTISLAALALRARVAAA